MASGNPEFNLERFEDASELRFAVIISRWNREINDEMLAGAQKAFSDYGVPLDNVDVFYVPGAFEIPLMAQELADTESYSAILCFATVIKGDTLHFELVVNETNRGIMQTSLDFSIPVLNGILAVNNIEQAKERAFREKGNKGYELALSAMDFVKTLDALYQED